MEYVVSNRGKGKQSPEKKKKGRKKIGQPFFPAFVFQEQNDGIDRPKSTYNKKYHVINHESPAPQALFYGNRSFRKGQTEAQVPSRLPVIPVCKLFDYGIMAKFPIGVFSVIKTNVQPDAL